MYILKITTPKLPHILIHQQDSNEQKQSVLIEIITTIKKKKKKKKKVQWLQEYVARGVM